MRAVFCVGFVTMIILLSNKCVQYIAAVLKTSNFLVKVLCVNHFSFIPLKYIDIKFNILSWWKDYSAVFTFDDKNIVIKCKW